MTRRSTIAALCLLATALVPAPARAETRPRLFVVTTSTTGIEASELAAVDPSWAFELGRTRRFDVITRADVNALFAAEKRKDLAGCDSVTCATELAAALDARLLALPSIARLEDGVVLRLTILDAHDQRVIGRGQRECEDDADLWPTVIRQLVASVTTPAPDPELAAPFDRDRWRRRLRDLAGTATECRDLAACQQVGRERLADIERVLATTTFMPEDEDLRAALEDRRVTLTRELDALATALLRRAPPPAAGPGGAAGPGATAKHETPGDAEARTLAELAALEKKRLETEWTWQNRDEKSRLEASIERLQTELESLAKARAAASAAKRPAATTPSSKEEVATEQQLAAALLELAQTQWRWENRARREQLEQFAAQLRVKLATPARSPAASAAPH